MPIAAPISNPNFFCNCFLCRAKRSLGSVSPKERNAIMTQTGKTNKGVLGVCFLVQVKTIYDTLV